ncbi:MAG TPA: hydantoinase/oxoprolinase family protein [Stellaceae bacterium]|nr:hydantoinase/oxoprolinase family protein [Stellaceae bacterium]
MDDALTRAAIAIDVGGTFTDVTLLDRRDGTIWNAKTPSTPDDPSRAFATGIEEALALGKLAPDALGHVFHGTTVATNLILENKGARAALLTTLGFKHVLEIGRHDIPRNANMYSWIKPRRPVPPELIHEIPGRLDHRGTEIVPLDEGAVRDAARAIKAEGVRAIAICFLHSYADARHERRARELVLEEMPEALVSISAEVLPVFREYERSMATILNVYVMSAISSYVGKLERRLEEKRIAAPLLLMRSNGGVAGADTMRREPVQAALSGPAAGVMGALFMGDLAGFRNLIAIDIGGTSADICLVKNGKPRMTVEGRVGEWPLNLPMIDINTIGAGGGSIARVNAGGALSVGPESAGAAPGPVCYGRGGTEPTVTDANLALGRLPSTLLDGRIALDRAGAERAILERVGRPLGLDLKHAARGILSIIDNNMVGAIRVVSVERGHDPRDFALLPFGGAGPLHGASLARLLGIKTIIVPPAPGVLSAMGLLVASVKSEFARTALQRPPRYDVEQMRQVFSELQTQAENWLEHEHIPRTLRAIRWQASLRYLHQGFELTVPWAGERVAAEEIERTVAAFHALHDQLYTFNQPDTPVEIVTLRVTAEGQLPKPVLRKLAAGDDAQKAIAGEQIVDFDGEARPAPVYDRARLGAGAVLRGPAIVRQLDSTTVLFPGQRAEVHVYGSLIVEEE